MSNDDQPEIEASWCKPLEASRCQPLFLVFDCADFREASVRFLFF